MVVSASDIYVLIFSLSHTIYIRLSGGTYETEKKYSHCKCGMILRQRLLNNSDRGPVYKNLPEQRLGNDCTQMRLYSAVKPGLQSII